MDDDKEIMAHFEIYEYELEINIEGEGSTDPEEGTHIYEHGEEVTVEAIPEEGWKFINWTGDVAEGEEEEKEITIMMDDDKVLTANFEIKTYILSVETVGEGEVEIEPVKTEYEHGEEVNLTAIPEEGWEFAEWTGDETGTEEEITITMDDDKVLTANFEIKTYTLSVETVGEGEVEIEPVKTEYEHGEEVNLTAISEEGWEFVEWTGDYTGTEEEITITMDDDKNVIANFIQLFELEVRVSEGEGNITVEWGENQFVVEDTETFEIRDGTEVNLIADPAEGYEFDFWGGTDIPVGDRRDENINVTMDDDKLAPAYFVQIVETYELTIEAEEGGTTDPEPGTHTYEEGEEVTVEAIPDEGYVFVEWTGAETGTDTTITVTMDDHKTITAHFEELEEYELTIEAEEGGTTEPEPGTHTYEEGDEVTVEAIPDEGWEFSHWEGDYPDDESEEEQITIVMDDYKTITAHFEELEEYELTIEAEEGGTTEPEPGTHTYYEGDEVTVEAIPDEGYKFVEWTGDETGTETTITITMDDNKTITAHFEEEVVETYELKINIVGEGTVEVDGEEVEDGWTQEYEEGTDVMLEAIPEEGWEFDEWDGIDETGEQITITMDDDIEINVVFQEEEEEELIPGFTLILLLIASIISMVFYHKKNKT